MLGLLISVSSIAILAAAGGYEGGGSNEPQPARDSAILFQGHSLVDDFLWHAFRSWNAQAEVVADVAQSIIIGSPTNYFWDNSTGAKGVDSRAYLVAPSTDIYVYAEAGPVQALGGSAVAPTYPLDYGNRFVQLAWANGARPLHYIIWPTTRTGTEPYQSTPGDWNGDQNPTMEWRAKLDFNRAHYEAIIGYVQARAPVGAPAFRAIPGDALMAALCDTAAAGNLIGVGSSRAEFYTAMFSDDIHLTVFGKYAVACLHFACIFEQSPVGLSNAWVNEWDVAYSNMPTGAQAAQLQAIAWSVAQADSLGPFGAQVPADPYAGAGAGGADWWAPSAHSLQVPVPGSVAGSTQATLAWSFRYAAGAYDAGGVPTEFFFGEQFSKINVIGGDDTGGRGTGSELLSDGWTPYTLANVEPWANFLMPGQTYNFVLLVDAAGSLSGGNGIELWCNGSLVKARAGALANIDFGRLHMFASHDGASFNPCETQGWWISLDTVVPASTLFADLFDGAAGLRNLVDPTIAAVTPYAFQFGSPAGLQ